MNKVLHFGAAIAVLSTTLQAVTFSPATGYSSVKLFETDANQPITGLEYDNLGNVYYLTDVIGADTHTHTVLQRRSAANNYATPVTLFDYGSQMYGSFVRLNNRKLYFGESTDGTIRTFDLASSTQSLLATVDGNYDLDFSAGFGWLSANPGSATFTAENAILKLDLSNGGTTPVFSSQDYSGPVALDSAGNLYYGGTGFGIGGDIFRYTSTEISAGGLGPDGGHKWADNSNNGYFDFDGIKSLYQTDFATLNVFDTSATEGAATSVGSSTNSIGHLAHAAGSLAVNITDYGANNSAIFLVTPGTPAVDPKTFHGALVDADGKVIGFASVQLSASGIATVQIQARTVTARTRINLSGDSGLSYTPLGVVSLTHTTRGTFNVSIEALGGSVNGDLRPAQTSATATKYNIALSGINATTGGGYSIATVSKKGAVKITGVLPDGVPFSAASMLRDNNTFILYAASNKGANPPAFVGGQLLAEDLATTDVTGELNWSKSPQLSTSKGLHTDGVNITLAANGSIYDSTKPLPAGNATLALSGGNLAAPESTAVTVSAGGVPTIPTGSLKSWTGVNRKAGTFRATVAVPTVTKPVKGSGIYLQKTNSAWGFFPGTTVGGCIDLEPSH